MTTQFSFTAAPNWRHDFRQHALDVDPGLGRAGETQDDQGAHWILREPLLRSIIMSLAVDARELGRWDGSNMALDNRALLDLVVKRLDLGDQPPANSVAQCLFLASFIWKAVREMTALQAQLARAKNAVRPCESGELLP